MRRGFDADIVAHSNISKMSELLKLCASNKLSLDALKEIINALGPRLSSQVLCFHQACVNKNVTLEIVQLLRWIWPGALRLRDDDGRLPIHYLCWNVDLDENASIDILRFMIEVDPNLPRETNNRGYLPIHDAVDHKTTFCKELIGSYLESLRIELNGSLPIHDACCYGKRDDTADTIQYMLELDPELINAEGGDGRLPVHYAAERGRTKSIEMLLKFDPNAASKEINNGSRRLPLHLACGYHANGSNLSSLYLLGIGMEVPQLIMQGINM